MDARIQIKVDGNQGTFLGLNDPKLLPFLRGIVEDYKSSRVEFRNRRMALGHALLQIRRQSKHGAWGVFLEHVGELTGMHLNTLKNAIKIAEQFCTEDGRPDQAKIAAVADGSKNHRGGFLDSGSGGGDGSNNHRGGFLDAESARTCADGVTLRQLERSVGYRGGSGGEGLSMTTEAGGGGGEEPFGDPIISTPVGERRDGGDEDQGAGSYEAWLRQNSDEGELEEGGGGDEGDELEPAARGASGEQLGLESVYELIGRSMSRARQVAAIDEERRELVAAAVAEFQARLESINAGGSAPR